MNEGNKFSKRRRDMEEAERRGVREKERERENRTIESLHFNTCL